jgi:hypothetical protein
MKKGMTFLPTNIVNILTISVIKFGQKSIHHMMRHLTLSYKTKTSLSHKKATISYIKILDMTIYTLKL